ncbi:beta-galactosidase trimerization domain-containing protein [Silvibacterium acidisoli]|uniref:beta-galactosidase trimerization domain-containing protein n=1 Tax=Acidobacteriaceae bacterium ZG23-2 TaxID=2883246 RepID=UPI00406BE37C
MVTRREFMQGAAVASMMLGGLGKGLAFPVADADWFDKPMRWAQINMTEDDPAKMDVAFWMDYFRRIRADAVCLSAGGVVAFYPTDIRYHHRSRWLAGHEDFLADMVERCMQQDMVVLLRTDPHATYQDVYEAHPEWIAVDAEGNKRRHPDDPSMWITCALGGYNFDFMNDVTREIATRFHAYGIFSNRWTGSGMCYCDSCKKLFYDAYHQQLPRHRSLSDPAYRDYIVWEQQRLFALWELWDKTIRHARPHARYIANSGGGAGSGLDMTRVGELAPTLFADRQCRSGDMAPWANGKSGKEYRATLGMKAIGGIFNVGIIAPYRWLNSAKSPAETRMWVQDGMANGMRPWFNMVSGSVHDRRGLKVIEDLYVWHAKWDRYFRNTAPIARVGLVYSQQTAQFHAGPENMARMIDQPIDGMYQSLVEARIPFEMVHDRMFDAEHIDRYKLLLLPNIAALSDKQCDQLKAYVKRGGSLVATYETSLYDEHGTKRENFGLGDLFGAQYVSHVNTEKVVQNTYLHIDQPGTPLLRGLEDADYLMGGTWQLTTRATDQGMRAPLTRIPAVINLPMEKTFWTTEKTAEPEVYMHESGKGRVVYFPWDIDRLVWDVHSYDHLLLLQNAVEWAMNEPVPVRVKGAGFFDVTAWMQKDSMTVHLVNMTNAMAMRPDVCQLIPSQPQQVEIELPAGRRFVKAHALMKDAPLKAEHSGGTVRMSVESVLDYEVVAIDLA